MRRRRWWRLLFFIVVVTIFVVAVIVAVIVDVAVPGSSGSVGIIVADSGGGKYCFTARARP